MHFELNDEQVALRDGVRRFIDEQYSFESRRKQLAERSQSDRRMWAQFAELGWLGVLVPEQWDGLGWSLADAAIVLHEFGRGLVVEPYLENAVLGVRLLVAAEAPAGGELLARVVRGDALVGVALHEGGLRYAHDARSSVDPRDGGYRLSGRKILVAAGDVADHLIVSAKLGETLALLLVPAQAAGVERTAYRRIDGSWACDVGFTDVALRPEAVLASGQRAAEILDRSCDEAALGAGAQAIGCMERVVEITAKYLSERSQFGRRLADFQVLQHRLADLFIETEMARSALYSALSVIDGPADERRAAVSAARVRIDQAALKVGNQGIHLHGGIGMTMEYPVGHYYRRLLMLTRAYGDTEHHLERYERLRVEVA